VLKEGTHKIKEKDMDMAISPGGAKVCVTGVKVKTTSRVPTLDRQNANRVGLKKFRHNEKSEGKKEREQKVKRGDCPQKAGVGRGSAQFRGATFQQKARLHRGGKAYSTGKTAPGGGKCLPL